jgi:hypothetical protein
MRKIETAMNQAIASGKCWRSGNTEVCHREAYFGEWKSTVAEVKLHGNLIASISECGITLYDGGWRSNTTKSRLNAILRANGKPGDGIFQKNHKWFLQYDGNVEPFESGATLG